MVEELEAREPFTGYTGLPRGITQKTYAGTAVWNSRGMNLTQAARAMLGDPFAYFETALFTVYKMVLLNQTKYIPYLVYDRERGRWPTDEAGPPWPDYKYFKQLVREIVPAVASSGLAEIGAGLTEAQAVCHAKNILDNRFSSMTRETIDSTYLLGLGRDVLGEDPYDALYSTCYQGLANAIYGPDVVILAPDHRKRGVDLNFYQNKRCPDSHGYSEILTPGYRFPDAIVGYLVATRDVLSGGELPCKGIEWAFLRVEEAGTTYVMVLGTQELDHPVFCVDYAPSGHFVECIPDTIDDYWDLCPVAVGRLPHHTSTDVTIPAVGVLYRALPENARAPTAASDNAERERRARAVLARYRDGGATSNQTLARPMSALVRAQIEGALSTDGESFQVRLWTVDNIEYPAASKETPRAVNLDQPGNPPLLILALLSLANVAGDLLGKRAARHFGSARRFHLVSMAVSALLVLVLGSLAALLVPREAGRVIAHGRPVQCYREVLAGIPGKDGAFCAAWPESCTPVECPAQGPATVAAAIAAHPLLLLLGLVAIVDYFCEAVQSRFALFNLKPLAAFLATLVVVPLAHFFGYAETFPPAYVMLAGALGTCLCLYERPRGGSAAKHVELVTAEELEEGPDGPETRTALIHTGGQKAKDSAGMSAEGLTSHIQNPSKIQAEPQAKTPMQTWEFRAFTWRMGGKSSSRYQALEPGEVEKHVVERCPRDTDLADEREGSPSAAAGRSPVGRFLLLSVSLGVMVTSSAVWAVLPRVSSDHFGVNAFGFVAIDQILLPVYAGALLFVCDWLPPANVRALFLLDAHDCAQTLVQAACQAAAQCREARGAAALALVAAQRALVAARTVAFFWLAGRFSLTSLLFESTLLHVSMSSLIGMAGNVFANKAEVVDSVGEDSRRVFAAKGLGAVIVTIALILSGISKD